MNRELEILEHKYESLMSNPEKIEDDFFHSVISLFSYKKLARELSVIVDPLKYSGLSLKLVGN